MRGLRINFGPNGPVFDFSSPQVDFDTTTQNALVNLGTQAGSDLIFPDRGTTLQMDAAAGRMVNQSWANQTCNFAALAVLNFSQRTELQSNPFKLQDFKLTSISLSGPSAVLNVNSICVTGEQIGQTTTL